MDLRQFSEQLEAYISQLVDTSDHRTRWIAEQFRHLVCLFDVDQLRHRIETSSYASRSTLRDIIAELGKVDEDCALLARYFTDMSLRCQRRIAFMGGIPTSRILFQVRAHPDDIEGIVLYVARSSARDEHFLLAGMRKMVERLGAGYVSAYGSSTVGWGDA